MSGLAVFEAQMESTLIIITHLNIMQHIYSSIERKIMPNEENEI